jgi:hypothetical protein
MPAERTSATGLVRWTPTVTEPPAPMVEGDALTDTRAVAPAGQQATTGVLVPAAT